MSNLTETIQWPANVNKVDDQEDIVEALMNAAVADEESEIQGAPQAVDDRGDGGEEIDEGSGGLLQPRRRVLGEEQRHPDPEGYSDEQGDDRAAHGHPEHAGDAEPGMVARDGPFRGGQEVGFIAGQSGDRLHEQEHTDQGDQRDDERAGPDGQSEEDGVARPPTTGSTAGGRGLGRVAGPHVRVDGRFGVGHSSGGRGHRTF